MKNEEKDKEWKWEPKGERIKTVWGEKLNINKVWQEYPRPQLERKEWTNLNGLWNYYIIEKGGQKPDKPEGKILVPFPIESSLSGVMKPLTEKQELWYEKIVKIKNEWKNRKHLLLHFEAVDWRAEVYINNIKIGLHEGGYVPFYFDIQNYVDFEKESFDILVKVFDPTDKGYQPNGKQRLSPGNIWYTAVSGIWQTVWIESLKENYIKKLDIFPDYDNKKIKLITELNKDEQLPIKVEVNYKNKIIFSDNTLKSNNEINISLEKNFYSWSPDEPNLYNLEIILFSKDKETEQDRIKSYTAIRKISAGRDKNNILRFKLNNNFLFHMGTLDQGWFPDGLYTPPSEEAMIFDIQKLKDLGFNTIRKHVKVENARYYYNCDKIGMLVWQDMPSGNVFSNNWDYQKINGGKDEKRSEESKNNYFHEWGEIIDFCKFFQCIVIWTTFNEAWGQFETEKVVNFTKEKDPSRLINSACGGNHRICGDILSLHSYPAPTYYIKYDNEVNVLGEYGGIGLEIKGHTWKDSNWGYKVLKNKDEVSGEYLRFSQILFDFALKGFSAGIYTQTTDCESEINGLITYDRKEIKIHEDFIKKVNVGFIDSLKKYY